MAFPTSKTVAVDGTTDVLATHINKLEDKVGIDSSSDADSLDYRISEMESKHVYIEGMGMMWYGAIADIPSNWILADGTALNRTTYATLFTNIGVVHGSGDGSTTFNIPNNTNKMIVGASSDDSGVPKTNVTGSLTQSGGAYNHTNTEAEMFAHAHSDTFAVSAGGGHGHSLSMNAVGSHNHTVYRTTRSSDPHNTKDYGTGDNTYTSTGYGNSTTSSNGGHTPSGSANAVANHGHGFTGAVSSKGSTNAYNIMNPYIAAAYIIYAGV